MSALPRQLYKLGIFHFVSLSRIYWYLYLNKKTFLWTTKFRSFAKYVYRAKLFHKLATKFSGILLFQTNLDKKVL